MAKPSFPVRLFRELRTRLVRPVLPRHLLRGNLGEKAAKRHLKRLGLKFLAANVRSRRGEIDLVFREGDCLVFVEVKTRSSNDWNRPARAVDKKKQQSLVKAAFDYLRRIHHPSVSIRFDIVEVLLTGNDVHEVRHLPNSFGLPSPYRYH